MNELNELEEKILGILARESDYKSAALELSKFFLEEIKEAFISGRDHKDDSHFGTTEKYIETSFNDYLKSKYKI